jgi:putative DNA primase/helicase
MIGEQRLERFLERLDGVRRRSPGDGYTALCPAHEDENPSLSVREGDDGRVLVKCFAGCGVEEVVGAIGMSMADLFDSVGRNGSNRRSRIAETYDYRDQAGNLLFQVVRFEPKDFRQRRPDGNGGWAWNLAGVEPVLYRLPAVLRAVGYGRPVFVVEGERDAQRLESEGFAATTCPMGAGKWRDSYARTLAGGKVAILPDNDPPGRKHAERVAASLVNAGAKVKVLELPGLPEKGDVSDWLDAGGTAGELTRLAGEVPVAKLEPGAANRGPGVLLLEVEPEEVSWLWFGRLPRGKVVLIDGDPGLGKSVVTLDQPVGPRALARLRSGGGGERRGPGGLEGREQPGRFRASLGAHGPGRAVRAPGSQRPPLGRARRWPRAGGRGQAGGTLGGHLRAHAEDREAGVGGPREQGERARQARRREVGLGAPEPLHQH